ncbi:MAG TPA: hypothetical protein EYP32_03170, partial [Aquificaceae bacterium]|nr:hypothetical protein [Aquificaceae bacterium]
MEEKAKEEVQETTTEKVQEEVKEEIDLVLCATVTPDYFNMPSTACISHFACSTLYLKIPGSISYLSRI